MRMHRGSSKGGGPEGPPPETLPLSALPPLVVEVAVERAGAPKGFRPLELPPGSRVRDAVRAVGQAPEGSAVLLDDRPVPLDRALAPGDRVVVIPTFSGG